MFFVVFNWNASVDTGDGLSGYIYEISDEDDFSDIIHTWYVKMQSSTFGSPSDDVDETDGVYYWRLKAVDKAGNVSLPSQTWSFEIVDFNDWSLNDKTDANTNTEYDSDTITLDGIPAWYSLDVRISTWTLYKNDIDKWTWTTVTNDDVIYITIKSSKKYEKKISSLLTIANRVLTYDVTTKVEWSSNNCSLNATDKETIQFIYNNLIGSYSGSNLDNFTTTMQSMLRDQIDLTNDCNLQYLSDLINGSITITSTGTHIAPNCKSYAIAYETTLSGYYSSTFTKPIYFANTSSLNRYIDSKNPGDCHLNSYTTAYRYFTNADSSRHVALNGRIYRLISDADGYTSPDFVSVKYFKTLASLRSYIDGKNTPATIWNHTVDDSFTPLTYIAPNEKSYLIYKTDKGYMSYKLLKPRYFATLEELKSYINVRNPG